jgi:NAD(P)-dependent dehydrogenase (short-subunit alcohol dehydrogenase family)
LRFKTKNAVITGGSSGIGLAIARHLVAEGASVIITSRRKAELETAVADVGGKITAVQADSSDLADLDRVYETARSQNDKVDIVVANAGILEKASMGEISEAHFDRLFSVNVKGIVFTVQKALPLMPDAKAAVRNFARGWLVDLKHRRIRVNVISPGPIQTAGLASGVSDPSKTREVFEQLAAQIPLGRLGTSDDVAKVAVFLASEASTFINGADIQVDGGWAQV